ncbi:MAG: hypothetical protein GY861_25110 [bacterium]|nr:hypothetical protein [bacterium]
MEEYLITYRDTNLVRLTFYKNGDIKEKSIDSSHSTDMHFNSVGEWLDSYLGSGWATDMKIVTTSEALLVAI